MREAANVSMEKNDKTSVSKGHQYIKSKKKVAGAFLCGVPCLSNRKGSV
jgi:hypothetical protein